MTIDNYNRTMSVGYFISKIEVWNFTSHVRTFRHLYHLIDGVKHLVLNGSGFSLVRKLVAVYLVDRGQQSRHSVQARITQNSAINTP